LVEVHVVPEGVAFAPARPSRLSSLSRKGAVVAALLGMGRYPADAEPTPRLLQVLERTVRDADLVHVHHFGTYHRLFGFLADRHRLPLVYDADDSLASGLSRKWFPSRPPLLARIRGGAIERQLVRHASVTFASSEGEARRIRGGGAVVIKNAVPIREPGPGPIPDFGAKCLLFVGNLDFEPNRAALPFLLETIWPAVLEEVPDARLLIVGRCGDPGQLPMGRLQEAGAELHLNVPEMLPFYRRATVAVVPILSGAGTRIKVLEAAGLGLPVVATGSGADGLDMASGLHLIIENDAAAFAQACTRLLTDPTLYERIRLGGQSFVRQHHNPESIQTQITLAAAPLLGAPV
jgi:glycosyltransferase involved in cell wall biosynthesis